MGAPETEVGPVASGGDGAKNAVSLFQLLALLGIGAFSVLFFIKTQDAMILIFGLLAATMVGLGWGRIASFGLRRDPAAEAPAAPSVGSTPAPSTASEAGAAIRLTVQLGVGAFAVLMFIKTQDAMILIFGVIAVALVEMAFRRR